MGMRFYPCLGFGILLRSDPEFEFASFSKEEVVISEVVLQTGEQWEAFQYI